MVPKASRRRESGGGRFEDEDDLKQRIDKEQCLQRRSSSRLTSSNPVKLFANNRTLAFALAKASLGNNKALAFHRSLALATVTKAPSRSLAEP